MNKKKNQQEERITKIVKTGKNIKSGSGFMKEDMGGLISDEDGIIRKWRDYLS